MPYKNPEKRKEHFSNWSQSRNDKERTTRRKQLSRSRMIKAEAYWTVLLLYKRELPDLIRSLPKRTIARAKKIVEARIKQPVEMLEVPRGFVVDDE